MEEKRGTSAADVNLLFESNDPSCIPILESIGDGASRTKLALIYFEGRCGQASDYEKALRFTRGNGMPDAVAIEADIKVFNHNPPIESRQYFTLLDNLYRFNRPPNAMVAMVLCKMYLYGEGTSVNISQAVKIIEQIGDTGLFKRIYRTMSDERNKRLELFIRNSGNKKAMELFIKCQSSNVYESDNPRYIEIARASKEKRIEDAIAMSLDWFNEDPSEASAYCLLSYAYRRISEKQYLDAAAYLEPRMKEEESILNVLVYSSRKREYWDLNEKYISIGSDGIEFSYSRGRFYEHNRDVESACKFYQDCVRAGVNKRKDTHAIRDASIRLFRLHPDRVDSYWKYAEFAINASDYGKVVVLSALCEYGSDIERKNAENELSKMSNRNLDAAETMWNRTKDIRYQNIITRLKFRWNPNTDYRLDRDDDTDYIERNYHKLSPEKQLVALSELSWRYLKGRKNTPRDYKKTAHYLREEISIRDKFHMSKKYPEGRLGLMMYQGEIPADDDEVVFNYLYPMRHVQDYKLAVSNCLIWGKGTNQNVEEAIRILYEPVPSAQIQRQNLKKIAKMYYEGEGVKKDIGKAFIVLEQILKLDSFQASDVDMLCELSTADFEYPTQVDYMDYSQSKIRALLNAGFVSQGILKARYFDFARKKGSTVAAILESKFFIEEKKDFKLAYSLLRDAGVDSGDSIYAKIPQEDRVLINIDKALISHYNEY